MRRAAFLLLLFVPVSSCFADYDSFSLDQASFTITVSGMIDYEVTGPNPEVKDLSFRSFFVPQGGVLGVDSLSAGELFLDGERFFFINASGISGPVLYSAALSYNNFVSPVWLDYLELLNEVNYSSDLDSYLAFDDLVYVTPGMESKAGEVVEGVKYKATAVLRLMDFVHNHVVYDLVVGGDDVLPAQWVYENKKGTCDEYSVLAAALLRSIGVPVRFVHGYVESDVLGGFGPHSYLEVYLSGVWVPFDPTWAQYGFVDVSHIKFSDSASPVFVMSSISYKHRDVSLTADNPVISVVRDSSGQGNNFFNVSGFLDREKYYENDYAVLTLTVNSLYDKPVILPLRVTTTSSLEQVNPTSYILVNEGSRVVRLVFRTPGGVESNRYYVHPVSVQVPFSNVLVVNVSNYPGGPQASFSDVKNFLDNCDLVENPHLSLKIDFDDEFYGYSTVVNVTLINDGNQVLDDLIVRIPDHNLSLNVPSLSINKRFALPVNLSYSGYGSSDELLNVFQGEVILGSYSFELEHYPFVEAGMDVSYNFSGEDYNLSVLVNCNIPADSMVLNISSGDYSFSTNLSSAGGFSFLIPADLAGVDAGLELLVVDGFGNVHSVQKSLQLETGFFERIIYYIKRFIKLLLYS